MQQKLIAVIASLVLFACGFFIWRGLQPDTGRINSLPFVGAGEVLADTAAEVIHDRGLVVAVISAEHELAGSPLRDQWEAFRRELKKHPNVTLSATEKITPDPLDPQPDQTGCPLRAFREILTRRSQDDVIVFFMSAPDWRWLQERQMLPLPATGKLIVLATATSGPRYHYTPYFKEGMLAALVIRGGNITQTVPNPKTPREWFHSEYQVFTPQNYQSLPE